MSKPYLTKKEHSIVKCLALGLSNEEISAKLGISVNTVKFHLKKIYRENMLKNRVEAAGWYRDRSK